MIMGEALAPSWQTQGGLNLEERRSVGRIHEIASPATTKSNDESKS